jgi:hypothetical protein
MLKKLGLTNTADLMLRLGVVGEEEVEEESSAQELDEDDEVEDVGTVDADINDEIEDTSVNGSVGRSAEPGTTAARRESSDAEPKGNGLESRPTVTMEARAVRPKRALNGALFLTSP